MVGVLTSIKPFTVRSIPVHVLLNSSSRSCSSSGDDRTNCDQFETLEIRSQCRCSSILFLNRDEKSSMFRSTSVLPDWFWLALCIGLVQTVANQQSSGVQCGDSSEIPKLVCSQQRASLIMDFIILINSSGAESQ